jgi:hypothetical protein
MPAFGQPRTGPAELPPARGVLATAPFEDHTLVAHDDASCSVGCDLHTDEQPGRRSVGLLRIFVGRLPGHSNATSMLNLWTTNLIKAARGSLSGGAFGVNNLHIVVIMV